MDYEITEESDVESLPAAVRSGISRADPEDVGARDYRPITLALRGADGSLAGGLYGATMWTWLMIDGLWIAEELRGRGLGRRLLLSAESTAVERGCRGSWLGTFDFQAREFYERSGYTVFAELPGFPPGHTHYHLQKVLTPPNSLEGERSFSRFAPSG
jgi:GNAT superfamily N-acetyltransferase